MISWINQLAKRERQMLLAGSALLVLMLVYALIWIPLAHQRDALRTRVEHQRQTLEFLNQAAQMAGQVENPGNSDSSRNGQSLLSLADQSVRAARLAGALRSGVTPQ